MQRSGLFPTQSELEAASRIISAEAGRFIPSQVMRQIDQISQWRLPHQKAMTAAFEVGRSALEEFRYLIPRPVEVQAIQRRLVKLCAIERLIKSELINIKMHDMDPDYVMIDPAVTSRLKLLAMESRRLYSRGTPLTVLLEDLLYFVSDPDGILLDRVMLDRARNRAHFVQEC
jgi:hypothetical protein